MIATPGGGLQVPQPAYFTGCTIHATATSRTNYTTNVAEGDILQFDPLNHEAITAAPTVGVPTATFNGPLLVVTKANDESLKTLKTYATAPTTRKAGYLEGRAAPCQKVRAKVNGATTAGVTRLCAVAGTVELQPFGAGTVDQNNTLLGTTGKVVAIARETKGAGTAVMLVDWIGAGIV